MGRLDVKDEAPFFFASFMVRIKGQAVTRPMLILSIRNRRVFCVRHL